MKQLIKMFVMVYVLAMVACTGNITNYVTKEVKPSIFPDYTDVTLPVNIAPLNFKILSPDCKGLQVVMKGGNTELFCQGDYKISIPETKWHALLKENQGGKIEVTVYAKENGDWNRYAPFYWTIVADKIDSHLCYRIIDPGYEAWNKMGIYQRDLESFEEVPLYENKMNGYSCINCHSFCKGDPQTFMFHMRAYNSGTYLTRDGKTERLNMKNKRVFSASRYPAWHPSRKYIAFSINDTKQFFHSVDKNKVEVYDKASDVVIYDVDNYKYITSPLLMRKESFETFPAFSADGKTLYFCSSDSVSMPEEYLKAQYSICMTSFNPETGVIGNRIDTLLSASQIGKSASVPRISPDGKYLLLSMANYGQFHIWHKEADLYMIDLQTKRLFKPDNVNSNDVESYHGWSSNSRWIAFSSRRIDGLHTSPFFAYMDAEGKTYKPFVMPQKDADFYDTFLKSYNIPELVNGKIDLNVFEVDKIAKESEEIQVK